MDGANCLTESLRQWICFQKSSYEIRELIANNGAYRDRPPAEMCNFMKNIVSDLTIIYVIYIKENYIINMTQDRGLHGNLRELTEENQENYSERTSLLPSSCSHTSFFIRVLLSFRNQDSRVF